MSSMKRLVWGTIVLSMGLAVSVPAALGAGTKVSVSPGRGGVHTKFTLRFAIPAATGITGAINVSDYVTVSGQGHAGCIGETELPLHSAPAHTAFTITLNPSHLNGHWCSGTFTGALMQRETSVCQPGPVQAAIVCPLYVLAPQVIGRFRFTVTQPQPR